MKTFNLYRLKLTDEGTFGVISHEGVWWYTIELPDRDNKSNISCIPCGTYKCSLRYSPHFKKELYEIKDVKNRSYILIHSGNFAGDRAKGYQSHFYGCIGLGKKIGAFPNKYGKIQKAILNSRVAVDEFYDFLDGEDFILKIEDII